MLSNVFLIETIDDSLLAGVAAVHTKEDIALLVADQAIKSDAYRHVVVSSVNLRVPNAKSKVVLLYERGSGQPVG